MKKLTMVLGIVAASLFVFATSALAITDGAGDILVRLNPGRPPDYIDQLCAQLGATVTGYMESIDIYKISVSDSVSYKTILLNQDPLVDFAQEPRHYFYPDCNLPYEPDDPWFGYQWHLEKTRVDTAWTCSHAEGMIIAVLDNGVYLNHPDLVNNMFVFDEDLDPELPAEDPYDGIDNDGNGYVDDYWGYDAETPEDFPGCDPCDQNESAHGTLDAGTVAAETNNGIGVASVTWGGKFLTVQLSNTPGEPDTWVILNALDYVVNCFTPYSNLDVDVIALDVAYAGDIDPSLKAKIDEVTALPPDGPGILIVSPAGNRVATGGEEVGYPANYHRVVGVSGTDASDNFWDTPWDGSLHGQRVDLSAPAEFIFSTENGWNQQFYGPWGGTSAACPQVAGIAALCKEYFTSHPEEWAEVNMDTVRKALYVGAATWHPADPFSEFFGIGRIDAYNAVKYREKHYYIIAKLWNPENNHAYIQPAVEIRGTAMAKRLNYWKLYLDEDPAHPNLVTYGPTNIEKIESPLGMINMQGLSYGNHTLKLKVCRKLFGSGMQGEGVEDPVPLCKTHVVTFGNLYAGQLIAELKPDNSDTVDTELFDYSLNVINPTSNQIDFKYQVDYRYGGNSHVLFGPIEATLNARSEFDSKLLLTAEFSPSDSSGNYVWNLRLFDMNDTQIAVDSLLIVKE
jgi:hypothetical protein